MFGLKSASLFGETKKLEREIDEFVDIVSEVGLVFKSIVPTYLNHSANGKFEEMVEKVKEMESKADKITKDVEHTLYEETLIPDARSDVLRLLEHIDELIGMYQGNCYHFSIQKPNFPKEFHEDLIELTETVVNCVESLMFNCHDHFLEILNQLEIMHIKLLSMKKNQILNLVLLLEEFLILNYL